MWQRLCDHDGHRRLYMVNYFLWAEPRQGLGRVVSGSRRYMCHTQSMKSSVVELWHSFRANFLCVNNWLQLQRESYCWTDKGPKYPCAFRRTTGELIPGEFNTQSFYLKNGLIVVCEAKRNVNPSPAAPGTIWNLHYNLHFTALTLHYTAPHYTILHYTYTTLLTTLLLSTQH